MLVYAEKYTIPLLVVQKGNTGLVDYVVMGRSNAPLGTNQVIVLKTTARRLVRESTMHGSESDHPPPHVARMTSLAAAVETHLGPGGDRGRRLCRRNDCIAVHRVGSTNEGRAVTVKDGVPIPTAALTKP